MKRMVNRRRTVNMGRLRGEDEAEKTQQTTMTLMKNS